jgi:protocatechuate 3,4-dioxygenase beta subunit
VKWRTQRLLNNVKRGVELKLFWCGRRFIVMMRNKSLTTSDRRHFLQALTMGGLFWHSKGAFAQALTLTPSLTLGPYYPDRMPLDLDNDLLLINNAITPAIGSVAWITGRVLSQSGSPVRGALVEIWQADNNGAYIHSASPIANRDLNFQGYGKFLTGSDGKYLFRTVKPGLYPGRTRHIHYAITIPGQARFTSQLFVDGEPLNATDGLLNGVRDAAQRAAITPVWSPIASSAIGELAVKFDIVMGYTPSDTAAVARPTIVYMSGNNSYTGVASAASNIPGVASGSWISIYGENLATTTRTWGSGDIVAGKLPQAIDGVSVRIDGKAASVYYVSPKQVNVLAPAVANASSASVTVTTAAGTSDSVSIPLATFQPAFFTLADEYVAAIRADGSVADTSAPIAPGENVVVYGTGFGPTAPEVAADVAVTGAVPLANTARIWVDTTEVSLAFAGLVSPGLYQFNFVVPQLQNGDYSLQASVGGVRTSKIARLRVQK